MRRMMARPRSTVRSRGAVLLALVLVIATGLGSRTAIWPMDGWVRAYAGDALWAVAAYLGVALLRPAMTPSRTGAIAALIAVAVEVSQCWRPEWLETLRATRLGALVLGRGFLWTDLACYAVGAAGAALLDRAAPRLLWRRRQPRSSTGTNARCVGPT